MWTINSRKLKSNQDGRESLGWCLYHVVFFLIKGTIDTLKCHEDGLKLNVDSTKLLAENQVCSSKHDTSLERVVSADPY